MRRALGPLLAAGLSLMGSLAATLYLHRAASEALGSALDARLIAAGQSAALLLGGADRPRATGALLAALARTHSLDGAYVLGKGLSLLADSQGESGQTANLLRVDAKRAGEAFEGKASVDQAYRLGDLGVQTAYFPISSEGGSIDAVLALEAGEAFAAPAAGLARARQGALTLALVGSLALGVVAAQWTRAERERRESAARAARAEATRKLAAMAAHEIRNPLGIIRGTVELMQERGASSLSARDRAALSDVLEEVQRLRQLTDDLLDLSADRPLVKAPVRLDALLAEVAQAVTAAHPSVTVRQALETLPPVPADAMRLRQVFLNLLLNAAQAQGEGEIWVRGFPGPHEVTVRVIDQGPGISPELAGRLFEPFATTKAQGAGLGLALSRRLMEQHGGALEQVAAARGATFELRLPSGEV